MRRRTFLQSSSMIAGSFFINQSNHAETNQPNILMVLGDDMSWFDCEPYGSKQVKTPNMTKLANEGITFDAMFTSTAMCSPTRQQLYTGLYPVRNGAYPNHSRVYEGTNSIAHYLNQLGYRVGLIGKRHFNPTNSFPFEFLGKSDDKDQASNTQAIKEFINRDYHQPYCLIVASNEPHKPFNRGITSNYDPAKVVVPHYMVDCPETREELVRYYAEITYLDNQLGNCMNIIDQSPHKDNTVTIFTSEQGCQIPTQGKWSCYDSGLKTAFIVRWPNKIKSGTRTSAMTQYVDVVPTLIETVGSTPQNIDTGNSDLNGNTKFDGKSFLHVLQGETNIHRDYVFGAHTTRGIKNGSACYPIRSIRSDKYKLIQNLNHKTAFYNIESSQENTLFARWKELGKTNNQIAQIVDHYHHRPAEEFYDIQNDPLEQTNLASDPNYAKTKKALGLELNRWMKQQGDEGIETELKANERQGINGRPNWKPFTLQSK